jgi:hypothetical protein
LTTLYQWQELVKAFELIAEYDRQRPVVVKQYRLYHNDDGTIIGLWESDHPAGDNYVVLDDPDVFHRTPTNLLQVVNKQLKVLDPQPVHRVKLTKANAGQRVVKGHAALALTIKEEYSQTEYYGRTNT